MGKAGSATAAALTGLGAASWSHLLSAFDELGSRCLANTEDQSWSTWWVSLFAAVGGCLVGFVIGVFYRRREPPAPVRESVVVRDCPYCLERARTASLAPPPVSSSVAGSSSLAALSVDANQISDAVYIPRRRLRGKQTVR